MSFRISRPFCLMIAAVIFGVMWNLPATHADDPQPVVPESSAPSLAATQESIEMRYRRFEGTMQQLSEYLRKSDPSRAELLLRAFGKSKESDIPDQLQRVTKLLKQDQLGDAVERQEMVVADLQSLLELLMSEARKDELEQEKKRILELIKDVDKLLGKEIDARASTERGGQKTELQNQQKRVSEATQKLIDKVQSQDALKKAKQNEKDRSPSKSSDKDRDPSDKSKGKDADDKGSEKDSPPSLDQDGPETKEGKSDGAPKPRDDQDRPPKDQDPEKKLSDNSKDQPDEKQADVDSSSKGQSKEGKSSKGKPKSGPKKPSKPTPATPPSDPPQDQPPQESQDQQEDSSDPTTDKDDAQRKKPEKTPGRDDIERAKQEMDRAIEELKKDNKGKASNAQDKAIAELMKAKEKLEEILRQLREEERELVLVQLEARFRDMLIKQEAVNNGTLGIHAVPEDKRTDRHRNRSVELARSEDEISLLAAKALTLLKEEGSSVAFPEAVEQIRDDMLTVARRLDRVDVSEITQNIEQDIVEGLKEIIEAMQKELEKAKDKKQQPQKPQEQQPQPQGLVAKLAELKMLRSLQYRVNRRTKQLGRLVDGEQALDADIVSQLKQLSDRQSKVQKATYDLSTGKNQ